MSKKPKGSELLAHKWNERDLAKLLDVEHDGVSLVEFFPKGIPAPDGGWGTWHVRPDALAKLIAELVKHEKLPGFWVFPKGIPGPEVFEVGFAAGSARVR